MADQTRITEVLTELNALLGDVTPYKLAAVPPAEIQHVEKNAHYMPTKMYRQLVDNIKRDGNLASLPFCWRKADGTFVALSGNHRVDAARDAGLPLVLVLYTDAKLTKAQAVSIQLSHNALVGADNPQVLRELWNEIDDLRFKVYSGLDEKLLNTLEQAHIMRIAEEPLRFEELTILFMPSEIDRLEETAKRLGAKTKRRWAAQVEAFDRFFDALLSFKEASNIVNTGTAILAMTEIIEAWLAEHNESEHGNEKDTSQRT